MIRTAFWSWPVTVSLRWSCRVALSLGAVRCRDLQVFNSDELVEELLKEKFNDNMLESSAVAVFGQLESSAFYLRHRIVLDSVGRWVNWFMLQWAVFLAPGEAALVFVVECYRFSVEESLVDG